MKSLYFLLAMGLTLAFLQPIGVYGQNVKPSGNLAVQLYTFRKDMEKDVPGTLKKIRNLGFEYVEGHDAPYLVSDPDTFKAQLDAAGLTMFALHWNNLNDWRKDPSKILEVARKFEVQYTGIAWLKENREDGVTLQVVQEAADMLMNSCEEAKEAGLQLYYHIHGYELQPLGNNKTFFDTFIDRIDYGCVRLEMDVFWVTYAGQDPIKFITNYQDGIELFHIKNMADHVKTGVFTGADFMPPEMPGDYWVPLGMGKIDFKSVFEKGQEIGAKWYVLEMDNSDGDTFAAVAKSLAYIEKEGLLKQ